MADYQDWVVADYEASPVAHLIPIETYIDSVIKHMPSVAPDDIYEPVVVNVQLSGFNAVPIQIDYSPSWYDRLTEGVGSICGREAKHIEIKDIRGLCISDASASELSSIGKVKAYCRGKRINMPTLPEPPKAMSNDKLRQLGKWFEDRIKGKLVDVITDTLKGSTKIELQTKTAHNSELEKCICDTIKNQCIGGDAREFLKTFGSNERAKNTPVDDMTTKMARTVLRQLRQVIKGAEPKIDRHLAAKAAHALQETGNEEDLFGNIGLEAAGKLEDERQLYQQLARKSLAKHMEIINQIYRAAPITCHAKGKGKKKSKKTDDDDYYREYYYGNDVYNRYQTFAGRAVYMEPVAAAAEPQASLRGARLRKKQYQEQIKEVRVKSRIGADFELDRKPMPELEPIGTSAAAVSRRAMPELEPIGTPATISRRPMPELEPIGTSAAISRRPMPELEPIGTSAAISRRPMPELEPIGTSAAISRRHLPELEPIGTPAAAPRQLEPAFEKINSVKRINDGRPDIYDF
jgi:hypothetical protein